MLAIALWMIVYETKMHKKKIMSIWWELIIYFCIVNFL